MAQGNMRREGSDAPQVRCDQCKRWAYLDEAPFSSLRGARAAGKFACNLCTSQADLTTKVETAQQETADLRALVARLREQLSVLTTRFDTGGKTQPDTKARSVQEASPFSYTSVGETAEKSVDRTAPLGEAGAKPSTPSADEQALQLQTGVADHATATFATPIAVQIDANTGDQSMPPDATGVEQLTASPGEQTLLHNSGTDEATTYKAPTGIDYAEDPAQANTNATQVGD